MCTQRKEHKVVATGADHINLYAQRFIMLSLPWKGQKHVCTFPSMACIIYTVSTSCYNFVLFTLSMYFETKYLYEFTAPRRCVCTYHRSRLYRVKHSIFGKIASARHFKNNANCQI